MSYIIKSACGCNLGKVRANNEDNFYYNNRHLTLKNNAVKKPLFHQDTTDEVICFAVFDGMGGETHGEAASYIAASTFRSTIKKLEAFVIPPRQFLIDACLKMNKQICIEAEIEKCNGMGSTAAILYFHMDDVYMCNVGDSRVFRLRDNKIIQISVDHNNSAFLEKVCIDGQPKKATLTQYLGIPPEELLIEPYVAKDICKPGDRFIICSDGLTDMLTSYEIIRILNNNTENEQLCVQNLIDAALEKGGVDNITVILCDIFKES